MLLPCSICANACYLHASVYKAFHLLGFPKYCQQPFLGYLPRFASAEFFDQKHGAKVICKGKMCWMTRSAREISVWKKSENFSSLTSYIYCVKIANSKFICQIELHKIGLWTQVRQLPLHLTNAKQTLQAYSCLGLFYHPKYPVHKFPHSYLLITIQIILSAMHH